jgi:hypothetical protein
MRKSFELASILPAVVASVAVVAACDENPHSPPVGGMEITTSARSTSTTTADGWAISFSRYLVNVSSVSVVGGDQVLAASAEAQLIDQAAPGTKSLLVAPVRTARPWEDVSFGFAPVTAEANVTVVEPVTTADRDAMLAAGYSVYVEVGATKGGATKTLKLGLSTSTLFKDCGGDRDGVFVRGLVVPADGSDTADVLMDPSVLFLDDLAAPGAATRFDAIAAADADGNGAIDMTEVRAVSLETARASGGAYGVGEMAQLTDLGAFIEALAPRTVASFRAKGTCTPESQQ